MNGSRRSSALLCAAMHVARSHRPEHICTQAVAPREGQAIAGIVQLIIAHAQRGIVMDGLPLFMMRKCSSPIGSRSGCTAGGSAAIGAAAVGLVTRFRDATSRSLLRNEGYCAMLLHHARARARTCQA